MKKKKILIELKKIKKCIKKGSYPVASVQVGEIAATLPEIVSQAAEPDGNTAESSSTSHEKIMESIEKDKLLAERIYDMIFDFYSRDGVSVQGAREILRKVEKMFEYTLILSNEDNP